MKAAKSDTNVSASHEAEKSTTAVAHNEGDALRRRLFELGLWAHGLENYCSAGRLAFPPAPGLSASRNYKGEFQISVAVLTKCLELITEIRTAAAPEATQHELRELERIVGPLVTIGRSMSKNEVLDISEWDAWRENIAQRIGGTLVFDSFEREFADVGLGYLPQDLRELVHAGEFGILEEFDLADAIPRLGGILLSLEVIKEMLDRDAPLRSTLAVFAFLHEAVNELIADINNRLSRSRDESTEIFAMLDAASYTLAMESKKAFSRELAAVLTINSATSVFGRVEAAHGVLNDNVRQLLSGFLRLRDSEIKVHDVFPEFNRKLDDSLSLRTNLAEILELVRATEVDPADKFMSKLKFDLDEFLSAPVSYLFYKDRETFERFCDEIMVTAAGPDAGPILHRFSAYLETLLTQVNMRAVLQNHPIGVSLQP